MNDPCPITPALIGWSYRLAGGYASAYGDPAGEFGGAVGLALVEARRTYRPARGPFAAHAKAHVRSRLGRVLRRKMRRPATVRLDEVPAGSLGSHAPPVGWEVEYHDFVERIAARAGGRSGDVLRLTFLDARAGSSWRAGAILGLTREQAHNAYTHGIRAARERLGVA